MLAVMMGGRLERDGLGQRVQKGRREGEESRGKENARKRTRNNNRRS